MVVDEYFTCGDNLEDNRTVLESLFGRNPCLLIYSCLDIHGNGGPCNHLFLIMMLCSIFIESSGKILKSLRFGRFTGVIESLNLFKQLIYF